jgi:hypothetical protein
MLTPTFSRLVPVQSAEARAERLIMVRYFKNQLDENEKPTVLYVPGFMSDGTGPKSERLADLCKSKGYNYLCFDPEGN